MASFAVTLRYIISYGLLPFAIPIYIIFLYTIIKHHKHKPFSSKFFCLILSCGVTDLGYLAHYLIMFRLPREGFLVWVFLWFGDGLATWIVVQHFFWRIAQALGVVLMSLHRFTALVLPTKHGHIWTDGARTKAIVMKFVASMLLALPQLTSCKYKFGINANGTSVSATRARVSHTQQCDMLSRGMLTVVCGSSTVLLAFMYLCMFYKAWKHAHKITGASASAAREQKARKAQVNLAIAGCVISSTLMLISVHIGFATLFPESVIEHAVLYYSLQAVLTNLYSLINPFALLGFSAKIRAFFVYTVKCMLGMKPTQLPFAIPQAQQNKKVAEATPGQGKDEEQLGRETAK